MKTIELRKKSIMLIFFILGIINLNAQNVTIGNGTSSNNYNTWPSPYGNYEYGARYQIIITANEITNAGGTEGNITAIAFDVSNVNYCATLNGFSIKIGTTNQENFESSNSWLSGLTTVYNSNYQPVNGWNTHNFSTPFYWDV